MPWMGWNTVMAWNYMKMIQGKDYIMLIMAEHVLNRFVVQKGQGPTRIVSFYNGSALPYGRRKRCTLRHSCALLICTINSLNDYLTFLFLFTISITKAFSGMESQCHYSNATSHALLPNGIRLGFDQWTFGKGGYISQWFTISCILE